MPKRAVYRCVLYEPSTVPSSPKALSATRPVRMLMLAPKAPGPLVLVPAPRCTSMSSVLLARSGMFTQNTAWLSASLMGTPFTVTLMRVASLPRMRRPV